MDALEEIVPVSTLVQVLRRLSLYPGDDLVTFIKENKDLDTFKALLETLLLSNAPSHRLIKAFREFLMDHPNPSIFIEPLIESCRGMSSRDIKLQVNIAVLLYDVVQDDRLITLMIRRLEDLTNDIDLGKQLNIHEGDKLGTQLVQLSFRPGVLILAVKVGLQVPLLEKSTMWICENAATVSPIMIKAYSRRLKDVSITGCQKFFVQPFNRLLLRSSGLALGILQELTLPDSIILEGDFADSLWLVMTSENDENRQRASKLLSKVGDSMGLMKRVESVFTGKSIKVKKSMLQLLKEVLSRGAPPLSSALGLRRFLEKETNEEIVYWIVSCLISAGESGEALIKEALAINKSPCRVCWFSAIAELGMSEADASAVMAKKDDPLITLLATIDSIPPTTTMLKTVGLSPQLQLAALQDCLSKYPLIPIWKIIRLLSILKGEPELCKQLWRSIIILYMANPKLRQKFEAELSSSTVPVNPLAACREELLTRPTITQGLIINSVKTAQDLLAMVSITNESEYKQLNLWGHLVDHLRSKDSLSLSSEIVLPVALASHSPMVLRAIADTFPMVAKALVEHSLTILASYDKVEPSEEDLKILNTPDDQLPIVDVVTPIRKAQEAAAKKDPTKRTTTKAELAALEAELFRERQVKEKFKRFFEDIDQITLIVGAIADVEPRVLEPHLDELSKSIFGIGNWAERHITKLLYQLARCCSLPLGRYGPLMVSLRCTLNKSTFVDKNWNIPNKSDLFTAINKHLQGDALCPSSWKFIMPIMMDLLRHAVDEELEDVIVHSLLQAISRNCEFGLLWDALADVLEVFCRLASSMPGVGATLTGAVTFIINHAKIDSTMLDERVLLRMLKSEGDLERRFGLLVVETFVGRFREVLEASAQIKLWIAILCCDKVVSTTAQRVSELLYGEALCVSSNWKDIVDISLDADLDVSINVSAANALLNSLQIKPVEGIFNYLEVLYKQLFTSRLPEMAQVRAPKLDLTKESRRRLAMLFGTLGKGLESKKFTLDKAEIPRIINFCQSHAFFDPHENIHEEFLNAAGSIISAGLEDKAVIDSVAKVCDDFLSTKGKPDEEHDRVRVYAVILLAKVADRFPEDDSRRVRLLESLYATLSTPSESVQSAVADAMVLLFPLIESKLIIDHYEKFINSLRGPSIAIRRGAAYGLGALVKARGSHLLKEFGILERLCSTLQEKNATLEAKQGALFGLELISRYLGRSFEPYIVKLLETLIGAFADGREEIREASLEAAQMMMSTVSSLGARLLLPVLLELMLSTSWRSKVGAIEWLGAMASLSPKILAKQLPLILPKLVDSLTDSHHQVQYAAREALNRYGAVVRNPEIRALSGIIMDALANPPKSTEKCLHSLLHTAFAHVIDGPSLALIEPVLGRALRDRGTEGKKKAAQIIGNLATNLVDPRDLEGILLGLVPVLVNCLSDPVPEVRAHCGKVLGILVKTVGERPMGMKNLAEDLLGIIGNPHATSVDRAGAAQALAEILAARGANKIVGILEDVVAPSLVNNRASVRGGFVMLIGYLPAAFDTELSVLYEVGLCSLIGPSLGLLADENEAVREAANTACHNVIAGCARIDHVAIFDVLVETLSDGRWRCRLGCLQLFMEFLSKFSSAVSDAEMGIYAMPTMEELIAGGVDEERIRGLMSRTFLYRFDSNSSAIRHHALTIWKGLAGHPLRAIISILPMFIMDCCEMLMGGGEEEGREVVYKALEDMMCKIGDRLLSDLLDRCSNLAENNEEEQSSVGALFVTTITARLLGGGSFPGITNALLDLCIPKFIRILQMGLMSAEDASRVQACRLFVALVETAGRIGVVDLVEKIIGPMLEELLNDPVVDPVTLEGLVDLLGADETGMVFEITMNALLAKESPLKDPELAPAVCKVISAVFERVSSEAASKTVPTLRLLVASSTDEDCFRTTCKSILTALESDYDSSYQVSLSQFLEALYEDNPQVAFNIVKIYCSVPDASLLRFYDVWPKRMLNGDCSSGLIALLETVSPEGVYSLTLAINDALKGDIRLDDKDIVALIVKGLVIPLLTQTLSSRLDEEERRHLACRLCNRLATSVGGPAWGASLTSLVGALIRTASDRKTTSVHVFESLSACVVAQTKLIRPFHPQLQRIFANALTIDVTRDAAVEGLTALLPALSRPESLLTELFSMSEGGPNEVRMAALRILGLTKACCGEVSRVVEVAQICLTDEDERIRMTAAEWIKSIIEREEISTYSSSLKSLLSFSG